MTQLPVGARVRFRALPSIPRAWRGRTGIVVDVSSGRPTRYKVRLDGEEAALDGLAEDELEAVP
jgi:hypothetical protein